MAVAAASTADPNSNAEHDAVAKAHAAAQVGATLNIARFVLLKLVLGRMHGTLCLLCLIVHLHLQNCGLCGALPWCTKHGHNIW